MNYDCHVCGSELIPARTVMPFKTGSNAIVIIKGLRFCSAIRAESI
ncbi:YgiT-type zinc finger protein [bacterium]|nr:YgiT-type zinc finger protein [bacterium]